MALIVFDCCRWRDGSIDIWCRCRWEQCRVIQVDKRQRAPARPRGVTVANGWRVCDRAGPQSPATPALTGSQRQTMTPTSHHRRRCCCCCCSALTTAWRHRTPYANDRPTAGTIYQKTGSGLVLEFNVD